ncbi:hypothetical protein CAOG_04502 [Capsaspora owczarzaki ATCC 30864]|uniref:UBA domain-containing protein n=1 Tax=Capsaspora owczarzaki (strain ATCC 30864) TaxID=595528 RepID=A0A0D2WRD1_CAPO3|nr:hypothetical protein CAOG_04502 [Capsaspora owczarzaki ATCC 30864]KJE93753.1 hypothetical protein CAOG_004502 [Capsaspora owczarzaki ATCC 30864]|eukprot:XP_004348330.1 hypothetical protein CAOG_04502 [Capsaspora owczarzaki ATCC 30864]
MTAGLYSASVTKGLLCLSGATTLAAYYHLHGGSAADMGLAFSPAAVAGLQVWRLLTQPVMFSSPSELVVGAAVLYHMRVLERQYGSAKFASLVLVAGALATLLQLSAVVVVQSQAFSAASGLYGIIYALLVQFFFEVPASQPYRFCGVKLSHKSFAYIAAIQLLAVGGSSSVVSAVCGVMAGLLYRSNIASVQSLLLPSAIVRFFSSHVEPWFGSADSRDTVGVRVRRARRPDIQTPFFQPNSEARARAPPAARREPEPPSDEIVEQLTSMGFTREAVLDALRQSNNDVMRATNRLLDA